MEEEISLLLISTFFDISIQSITVGLAFDFIIILILLFCSALISGAEVAYFSLDVKGTNENYNYGNGEYIYNEEEDESNESWAFVLNKIFEYVCVENQQWQELMKLK